MQNFPLSETESKPVELKAADTLEPSGMPGQVVVEGKDASNPLLKTITPVATTKQSLTKTLRNLDFPALRLQASLLAGSIGEWQVVEGARVKSETVFLTQPNGRKYKAIRIFLAIDENDLEVVESADGIDFAVNGDRLKIVEGSGK